MNNKLIPVSSVHGRFQPLHNQHLEYILEAKKKCDFLWIGITQYNIRELQSTPGNKHRSEAQNNPLTYFERVCILKDTLTKKGIKENKFSFVPFPIETPHLLTDFLPLNIPIFTTICDNWNYQKIRLLESIGYQVIVLFERKNEIIRGKAIRSDIVEGGQKWKSKVPEPSAEAVHQLQVKKRLEKNITSIEKE